MIKEFKTFFSNVVKENPCVKNAVQMSEIQQQLSFSLSHLNNGCVDQRLEVNEAGVPVICSPAVYRARQAAGCSRRSNDSNQSKCICKGPLLKVIQYKS